MATVPLQSRDCGVSDPIPLFGQSPLEKFGLLMLGAKLLRCAISRRLMRPALVAVDTPRFNLLLRVVK